MVKVPFALNKKGEVEFPQNANRKSKWSCPSCSSELVVKRGSILVPHFAHKTKTRSCTGETLAHRATKEWIASIAGSPNFKITAQCSNCHCVFDAFRGSQEFTGLTEVKMGAYRVDVALKLTDGSIAAAFEVYRTHRTDSLKMRTLLSLTACNAFEIQAVDNLVAANYPTTFESIRPMICKICIRSALSQRQCKSEHTRALNARAVGRKWIYFAAQKIKERQRKFSQRWLLLIRVPTVARRTKTLHFLDERDRIKPCTACGENIELFKWVKSKGAPWGYLKEPLPHQIPPCSCAEIKGQFYHCGCETPWCETCHEIIKPGTWCECERSVRRKCVDCGKWELLKDMHSYINPPSSDFQESWVCDSCAVTCRLCNKKISHQQSKYGGACFTCNRKAKRQRMGQSGESEYYCHCGKRKDPKYITCYTCAFDH